MAPAAHRQQHGNASPSKFWDIIDNQVGTGRKLADLEQKQLQGKGQPAARLKQPLASNYDKPQRLPGALQHAASSTTSTVQLTLPNTITIRQNRPATAPIHRRHPDQAPDHQQHTENACGSWQLEAEEVQNGQGCGATSSHHEQVQECSAMVGHSAQSDTREQGKDSQLHKLNPQLASTVISNDAGHQEHNFNYGNFVANNEDTTADDTQLLETTPFAHPHNPVHFSDELQPGSPRGPIQQHIHPVRPAWHTQTHATTNKYKWRGAASHQPEQARVNIPSAKQQSSNYKPQQQQMHHQQQQQQQQDLNSSMSPHARYAQILERVGKVKERQDVVNNLGVQQPPEHEQDEQEAANEEVQPSSEQQQPINPAFKGLLLEWGKAWRSTLEHEYETAHLARMTRLQRLMSGAAVTGPNAMESALDEREQALLDVNRCLELLDLYTMMQPEVQPRRLVDRVERDAELGIDAATGLRVLPDPPQPFPTSSAWDYLVASQVAVGGLAELEDTMERMRHKIQVATTAAGFAAGLATSPVLSAIEDKLQLAELASVRAQSQTMGYRVSGYSQFSPRDSYALQARMTTGLSQSQLRTPFRSSAAFHSCTSVPSMLPRPSHTTPPRLPILSETNQLLDGDGTQAMQSCSPRTPAHHQSTGVCQSTTEMLSPVNSPRVFESPLQLLASSQQSHPQSPDMDIPSLSEILQNDNTGNNVTATEMWGWLENLMLELSDVEEARGTVCQLAASANNRAVLTMPAVRNPHTSEPPPIDAVTNLVEQMTKLRVLLLPMFARQLLANRFATSSYLVHHLQAAIAKGGTHEALHDVKDEMPYADQVTLRAATLTHFDPSSMERLLHFMLQLATCLSNPGGLQPRDAGFLLTVSIDMLLGELGWILALLRTQQGPASPHLRALHSTLRAHDAQAHYTRLLAEHVDEVRAALDTSLERAERAEVTAAVLEPKLKEATTTVTRLTAINTELQRSKAHLEAQVDQTANELQAARRSLELRDKQYAELEKQMAAQAAEIETLRQQQAAYAQQALKMEQMLQNESSHQGKDNKHRHGRTSMTNGVLSPSVAGSMAGDQDISRQQTHKSSILRRESFKQSRIGSQKSAATLRMSMPGNAELLKQIDSD